MLCLVKRDYVQMKSLSRERMVYKLMLINSKIKALQQVFEGMPRVSYWK